MVAGNRAKDGASDAALLASGAAFTDLSSWRLLAIGGSDARTWLNDLVSADISGLAPGQAHQSLLLSPTGRIRAVFTAAVVEDTLLLIQDPEHPKAIAGLLSPYVLSSDVSLEDRTGGLSLFAFPGLDAAPDVAGGMPSAPSCLGTGVDVVAPGPAHDRALATLQNLFTQVGGEVLESWRVTSGLPRFGVDVYEDDLPQEAGLAGAVSFDKGCYLGQEAVAKVRNLGHPRRVVIPMVARQPVSPGESIMSNGLEAGQVTSVAAGTNTWFVLARVKWEARGDELTTGGGALLQPRHSDG